jgi:hypothetical protein
MNNGVKALLDRMDTNPEEFEHDGKWLATYNFYKKYMTEEERDAVNTRLNKLKMAEFEKKIVERLFEEKKENKTMKVTQVRDILESGLNDIFAKEYEQYSKRVSLTPTDISLANKLGMPLDQYAKQKAKI